MYRSEINIKHSNRSHLYWGIDKATGEVVGIDDVRSRGLNCNCKCAACNGDFIARKGEKNKHHFAHQSNYECVYANELAKNKLSVSCTSFFPDGFLFIILQEPV